MENRPIRWLETVHAYNDGLSNTRTNTSSTNTCTNASTNDHANSAHADSHFVAHASTTPTWMATAARSLPRD
jgi:hypothetical protein